MKCKHCGDKNERSPTLISKDLVTCYACEINFPIAQLSDFAQFFTALPKSTKDSQ